MSRLVLLKNRREALSNCQDTVVAHVSWDVQRMENTWRNGGTRKSGRWSWSLKSKESATVFLLHCFAYPFFFVFLYVELMCWRNLLGWRRRGSKVIHPVGARDRPGANGGTGRAFGCSRWIHSGSTRSARSTRRPRSPVLFVSFCLQMFKLPWGIVWYHEY